jgi:hypothetical protein
MVPAGVAAKRKKTTLFGLKFFDGAWVERE